MPLLRRPVNVEMAADWVASETPPARSWSAWLVVVKPADHHCS